MCLAISGHMLQEGYIGEQELRWVGRSRQKVAVGTYPVSVVIMQCEPEVRGYAEQNRRLGLG